MATATKVDLKKDLSELYGAPRTPVLVDVPERGFLMVDGAGSPEGSPEFRLAIGALYPVAYTVKFSRKPSGLDFAVPPLESLWWTGEDGSLDIDAMGSWRWRAMIPLPDEVDEAMVADAVRRVEKKPTTPSLTEVRYERWREGRAAQVLHIGPYEAERPTIEALHAYISERGLVRRGPHHEIYLGDPARTKPERLRTVLRQPVEERG